MSKIAVVTGSAGHIGGAIMRELERYGYLVHQYDTKHGRDVLAPKVGALPSVVDVLVHCASVKAVGCLEDTSSAHWDLTLDVDAKGIFIMTKTLLPSLRNAYGTVVTIVDGSQYARRSAASAAATGAATAMTEYMAAELSPDITAFSVVINSDCATNMRTRWDDADSTDEFYECAAEFVGLLVQSKRHNKYLSGCTLMYGAKHGALDL